VFFHFIFQDLLPVEQGNRNLLDASMMKFLEENHPKPAKKSMYHTFFPL